MLQELRSVQRMEACADKTRRIADVVEIRSGHKDAKIISTEPVDEAACSLDNAERVRPALTQRHDQSRSSLARPGDFRLIGHPSLHRSQPVGET